MYCYTVFIKTELRFTGIPYIVAPPRISTAIQGWRAEMIKFLLFPFRYFTTSSARFFKLKVAVACWSNLQHEQLCTSFTNEAMVFEMREQLEKE